MNFWSIIVRIDLQQFCTDAKRINWRYAKDQNFYRKEKCHINLITSNRNNLTITWAHKCNNLNLNLIIINNINKYFNNLDIGVDLKNMYNVLSTTLIKEVNIRRIYKCIKIIKMLSDIMLYKIKLFLQTETALL